ncbi:hypothetical protein [Acinetobacter haemolyticus]|uniref:hypothetical protein n=1 Tax=Acinetobacter haemolyticus TaxID=29430 RepID=UPI000C2C0333|nr:hypothetical protein [Acinetobacter haemolyticus]
MNRAIIEQAIKTKSIIEFSYKGHHRIAEPHVLGVSKGDLQVLSYQVGGTSNSGGVPNWRRFELIGITNLVITDRKFNGRRPFPSGHHSIWDEKLLIVSP